MLAGTCVASLLATDSRCAPLAAFPQAGGAAPPWVSQIQAQIHGMQVQIQGQVQGLQGQVQVVLDQQDQLQDHMMEMQSSIDRLLNRTSMAVTLAREANQLAKLDSHVLTPVPNLDTGAPPPPGFPATRGGERVVVAAASHCFCF